MDPFADYYKTGEAAYYLIEEELWNGDYADAMEWYDRILRPLLEPEHNGLFVVFDWRTGDYALGKTGKEACRVLTEATKTTPYTLTVTGVGLPHGHRWVQEYPLVGDPMTGLGRILLKPKRRAAPAESRIRRRRRTNPPPVFIASGLRKRCGTTKKHRRWHGTTESSSRL